MITFLIYFADSWLEVLENKYFPVISTQPAREKIQFTSLRADTTLIYCLLFICHNLYKATEKN